MKDGFIKVAAVTTVVRPADCMYNAEQIIAAIGTLPETTALVVFPELCITGYTCDDLFWQTTLQKGAEEALKTILKATAHTETVIVVGLPIADGASLYNCAAVCCKGRLLGLVPKIRLSMNANTDEGRQFTSGRGVNKTISFAGRAVLLSGDTIFRCAETPDFCFGVELNDSRWGGGAPGDRLAAAGATIIVNPSAGVELAGSRACRQQFVAEQSMRLCAGYVYASAGSGESVSDLVFSGHNLIAENGTILAESDRFATGCISSDIDVQALQHERRCQKNDDSISTEAIGFSLPVKETNILRVIESHPFVPADLTARNTHCEEVLMIQSHALAQRLKHTNCEAVLGLSGGLDSALALLVTVRAYELLKRDVTGICAVTMPCFGTTGRTYHNACELARVCGVTLREIPIADSVRQHFIDIGHDGRPDITYENSQARERTQVLMDMANKTNSLVIGTGDLSELALGWATYNGDHMSMYGVNASVPKTLVRALVEYEANRCAGVFQTVLLDILDTPVSPELLPPDEGTIAQKTENIVGSYDLHDFFLYHMLCHGSSPAKLFHMARLAFGDTVDGDEIKRCLCLFLRRFFAQQFKRNCLPDGPKVGCVSLSPRGGWHMPSDALANLWINEAEKL